MGSFGEGTNGDNGCRLETAHYKEKKGRRVWKH